MLENPLRSTCEVNGCERVMQTKGLCDMHYRRQLHNGRTERTTVAERFWRYARTSDGCWTWTGQISAAGYAVLRKGSDGHYMAHRVSYEIHKGLIPEGLQIDHLCRNRGCTNPDHLEAVTQQVNILRSDNMAARWARRVVCHKCGGPFTQYAKRRVCLACDNARKRKTTA